MAIKAVQNIVHKAKKIFFIKAPHLHISVADFLKIILLFKKVNQIGQEGALSETTINPLQKARKSL
ncbi:MAG: hypothetical protein IJ410_05695 [Oscillospiraceae bacterium]|nr:hypothetical protein [Oscillospiraceae bacterium]